MQVDNADDTGTAPVLWYVMLFPAVRAPLPGQQALAALTGGSAIAEPHVTIGYFAAADAGVDLAAPLRQMTGPPVTIHADTPYNDRVTDPRATGQSLLVHVARTPALAWWHRAVGAAVGAHARPLWDSWEDTTPHLHAVERMTMPLGEALTRVARRSWGITFAATTLVVSQRLGERPYERLAQPLAGGAPLNRWRR